MNLRGDVDGEVKVSEQGEELVLGILEGEGVL